MLAIRAANMLVTIQSRSYLQSKFGLTRRKMLYVESCPDQDRVLASAEAISRFQPSARDFVICCSGGHEHHRLERFIPIFQALLSRVPNAFLLVIADPAKPVSKLSLEWAAANGLTSRVACLPVIKPLEDFYATVALCDLWVATLGDDTVQGRHEFRMELLEIGLLAKPVVSAGTPGLTTHGLTDGEDILFIDPADPGRSADKIALMVARPRALRKIGESLQRRVREQFSLRTAVDVLIEAVR